MLKPWYWLNRKSRSYILIHVLIFSLFDTWSNDLLIPEVGPNFIKNTSMEYNDKTLYYICSFIEFYQTIFFKCGRGVEPISNECPSRQIFIKYGEFGNHICLTVWIIIVWWVNAPNIKPAKIINKIITYL